MSAEPTSSTASTPPGPPPTTLTTPPSNTVAAGGGPAETTTAAGAADGSGTPKPTSEGSTPSPAKNAAKPADAAPATPPAPLQLKAPDGVEAPEALTKFAALANELKLDGQGAQKVVDLFGEAVRTAEAAKAAELEKLHASWASALKADKEVGGAEFDANTQVARKAIAKFGSPELRAFLETTGLGNHPELVRWAYRVGKALGEDSVAGATQSPGQQPDEEARLRQWYPTMFSNAG